MHKCLNCGAEFEGNFCPECGTKRQEEKTCPRCGKTLRPYARFCSGCGYSFTQHSAEDNSDGASEQSVGQVPSNSAQQNAWGGVQPSSTERQQPQCTQQPQYTQPAQQYAAQPQYTQPAYTAQPAAKGSGLGKFYGFLKFIPTILLTLFGLLSLLFFLGSVVVAKALGESEGSESLYTFAFSSSEEFEMLKEIVNFQASGIALFVVVMLTLVLAGVALYLSFAPNKKFKTVNVGKFAVSLGEVIAYAGMVLVFAAFIIGCVICGQVSSIDNELGSFGFHYKAGAAPVLFVVFGIIFLLIAAAGAIAKILLGKKFPQFVAAEDLKRLAAEKAYLEKQAALAATAGAECAAAYDGSDAPSGKRDSIFDGRPVGLGISKFAKMRRILGFFTLILILASSAAITLAWLTVIPLDGQYLIYTFWGTFGALLLVAALSLVIPVNLKNWTPAKILAKSSKGKSLAAGIVSLIFSLFPLSFVIYCKLIDDIMYFAPLLFSVFGVLMSVFMIMLAVDASKLGEKLSEHFYGSIQKGGRLSAADYDPVAAKQEVINYRKVKTGRAKRKPDVLLIVAASLFLVFAVTMASVFPNFTNKFSANYLSQLKMGTERYTVEWYLGEPDNESEIDEDSWSNFDGAYYYFSDNHRSIYKEMEQIENDYETALENGDFQTIARLETKRAALEDKLEKLEFKYIAVEFENSELTGITYDAKCTYDEDKVIDKKVDTLTLSNKSVYIGSNFDEITVNATYTDGSFRYYKLSDARVTVDRQLGRQKIEWRDDWGEYSDYVTFTNKVSGTVGNLNWELKYENGANKLNITGSGELSYSNDYGNYGAPWENYASRINEISIGDRVTSICSNAFKDYSSLRNVTIGSGIRQIGYNAFAGCTATIRISVSESAASNWDSSWSGSCYVIWGSSSSSGGEEYKLTFVSNGGSSCSSLTGPTINSLPTPTRSGYHFIGWFENPSFSGEPAVAPYTVGSSGKTLYAAWMSNAEWDEMYAEYDGTTFAKARYTLLSTPNEVNITSGGQKVYFQITPTSSGTYIFQTTGNIDTIGALYSSSNTSSALETDDDDGQGNNFLISRTLQSGTTYYLEVKLYNTSSTGTFNLTVTKG